MESLQNPFAPSTGTPPPELAGRDDVLTKVRESYLRARMGLPCRPFMLLGLRGVGKTVLLNEIARLASEDGIVVSQVESPEIEPLADLLFPLMGKALRTLSAVEKSKDLAGKGLRALRNFASALKVKYGDLEVGIAPETEPGIADTGNIEYDLPDMFELIGQTAKKGKNAWLLLIDEVQYLNERDLSALIVALHKMAQKGLPVVLVGAGLPQVARLAGSAKSYAERLFLYPTIGTLSADAVENAVVKPLTARNARITPEALAALVKGTRGYPFFIQEWAFNTWNCAPTSCLTLSDVEHAYPRTIKNLDESFFRVRSDRLTNREITFVKAMASLGEGPYTMESVLSVLQTTSSRVSPVRSSLIKKGMIYSPRHGLLAFTVPLFEEYLNRDVQLNY